MSDPDFGKVAPAVLDAFVADMAETGHGAVIIGRVRYDIRRFRGDVAVGAVPEFAVCVDPAVIDTTMRWLHDNYAPLLRRQVTARA